MPKWIGEAKGRPSLPKVLEEALNEALPLLEQGFYGEVALTWKVQDGQINEVIIETRRRVKAAKKGGKRAK